jgi:hypothetical protein
VSVIPIVFDGAVPASGVVVTEASGVGLRSFGAAPEWQAATLAETAASASACAMSWVRFG